MNILTKRNTSYADLVAGHCRHLNKAQARELRHFWTMLVARELSEHDAYQQLRVIYARMQTEGR